MSDIVSSERHGFVKVVPRQFYDLLVGGMISSALVPVFSEYAEHDKTILWHIASLILSLTTIVLIIFVILAQLFAPQIAWLLGGDELDLVLLTHLLRITMPAMLFLSLSGIVTGLLYALKRFVLPAFTAATFNASIVTVTLIGVLIFKQGIEVIAIGLVIGSILQLVIQLPGLRQATLRFRVDMHHAILRQIGRLYQPVILGLVVTLFQTSLDRRLANSIAESTLAWMQNATTLIQFPIGLVSVAISLAILPTLSRQASQKNIAFMCTLTSGLKLVLILIIPSTVALFILAEPIIALLFEHGAFTTYDTMQTALALRFYLVGLIFAAVDQPLIFAFYARQDTFTPAMVGIISVGIYLLFALSPMLIRPLQMTDLIFADSMKHVGHVIMMLWLTNCFGKIRGHGLTLTMFKSFTAAIVMGTTLWVLQHGLHVIFPTTHFFNEVLIVGILFVVGGVVYLGIILLLKVDEMTLLMNIIKDKMINH
ncbi:MAG: murein biosynthesis integral membrane protein MurJ [Anaerolineaceae bacterium 4572_78]|nr:MAG: murein biosynthesis integral membrane protein MurJ [Anaerolineaceae bacterium 4572_78]